MATTSETAKPRGFRTLLSHVGRGTKHEHGFVNPPLAARVHGSGADRRRASGAAARRGERVLTYGTGGSATHWALEDTIAAVEGGTHCYIVSTGLAAVTTPLLAWLKAGDHLLVPDHVYGPARNFCDGHAAKDFGVETTFMHPTIDEAGIAALMRPNTRVVYTESPGSHTFEVQDVPAIARAAHAGGAKVFMDNTWGIHHFQPFRHGVDVSIQAATKYPAGHSDVLIGAITVNNDADWQMLHAAGSNAGAIRQPGRLLADPARHAHHGGAAANANGLGAADRPLAPPAAGGGAGAAPGLPGAPGHDLWRRDFTGACSLFGVEFKPSFTAAGDAPVRGGARSVRDRRVLGRI